MSTTQNSTAQDARVATTTELGLLRVQGAGDPTLRAALPVQLGAPPQYELAAVNELGTRYSAAALCASLGSAVVGIATYAANLDELAVCMLLLCGFAALVGLCITDRTESLQRAVTFKWTSAYQAELLHPYSRFRALASEHEGGVRVSIVRWDPTHPEGATEPAYDTAVVSENAAHDEEEIIGLFLSAKQQAEELEERSRETWLLRQPEELALADRRLQMRSMANRLNQDVS